MNPITMIASGSSVMSAFLVALQRNNFDVKDSNDETYMFTYRGVDSAEISSDITDHFTEDNRAIQDQIALKPVTITLEGCVGELTDKLPGILQQINTVASRLTVLAPFVPEITAQALKQYNNAQQVYRTFASAVKTLTQVVQTVMDGRIQSEQQKSFEYFYQRWQDRSLFTVQTPWQIFDNMAILSMRVTQNEDTNTVSDFVITFKQMRFARSLLSDPRQVQGRLEAQNQSIVDQGIQKPANLSFGLGSLLDSSSSVQQGIFS